MNAHERSSGRPAGAPTRKLMPLQQSREPRQSDLAVAALLKQLREERGITQETLAFDAGITASALSRIERGLNRPGWETIMKLVEVLGMSLREFGGHLDEALMPP